MLHALVLAAILNGTVLLHHRTGADEPAPAVLVELSQENVVVATAMTAQDGTFSLPDLAPGSYRIRITSNFSGSGGRITVTANARDEARMFYLFEPTCGGKYGRVRDAITGESVPGALVYYLGGAYSEANGDYFIGYGCFAGPGFRFHNSFFYGVLAEGYRPIDIFGGRAEYVSGNGGGIADWDLQPLPQRVGRVPWGREGK